MERKFVGEIEYTIDKDYPDYACCPVGKRDKILKSSSAYVMNENYFNGYEEMTKYIIHDLLLIAGGGYNYDHVHNVKFEITEI